MLSIGEVAHATGVTRRMLRHWEDVGLLEPAAVDEHTGYRRYAHSQVGRVRAIAALRAVGFGLEAIKDLLGPGSPSGVWSSCSGAARPSSWPRSTMPQRS